MKSNRNWPATAALSEAGILGIRPEDFVISNETVAGGVALGLTVEAIERVGAETFIYGTRQHEAQGVAANPGELPPGEVIVRIPGADRARHRRANQGRRAARQAASVYRRRPQADRSDAQADDSDPRIRSPDPKSAPPRPIYAAS